MTAGDASDRSRPDTGSHAAAPQHDSVDPQIDRIESRIAHDLAKHGLYVAPIITLGVGLWRGPDAAGAVALAFALVIGNFLLSAAILSWFARRSPEILLGVALMSFLVRLVLLTVIGVGIKELGVVDWPVFCITLIVSYLGLLFWEMRYISLSLASPGLKPSTNRRWG
jgi:hypothetical protein